MRSNFIFYVNNRKSGDDPLIQIHEHIAQDATEQRWKDGDVFAFERMGGGHLLVGLNKDAGAAIFLSSERKRTSPNVEAR